MFCPNCGNQVADGFKFCSNCGATINVPAPAAAPVQPAPVAPVQPAPAPVQPAPAPAPVPAPAPKKKKNAGPVIGLIAAILVLAALACAFFFWIQPTFLSDAAKYEKAVEAAETAFDDEDYDTAIAEYETALEYAADDDQKLAVYLARAEAYMNAEDYEAAIEDYEAALDIDEDQKKVWALMADAYIALEDTDKAVEVLLEGYEATESDSLLEKLEELGATGPEAGASGEADRGDVQVSVDSEPQPTVTPGESMRPETVEIGGYTFNTDETWVDLTGLGLYDADIESLVYFEELETLYLDHNNITDISVLAGLQNLIYIDLYDNEISDISPLAGLTNLQNLTLWDNPVEDISPLAGLVNLIYLDLDNTLVSDVTPLLGLTNLETLYLSGEKLPDEAWDMIYASLPQFAPVPLVGLIGSEFGYDTLYFGMSDLIPYEYMTSDPFHDFCYMTCDMLSGELGLIPAPITYSVPDATILQALANGEIDCALVRLPIETNEALFEELGLAWTYPIIETPEGSLVICVRADDYGMLEMLSVGIEMMYADGLADELLMFWEENGLSVWY